MKFGLRMILEINFVMLYSYTFWNISLCVHNCMQDKYVKSGFYSFFFRDDISDSGKFTRFITFLFSLGIVQFKPKCPNIWQYVKRKWKITHVCTTVAHTCYKKRPPLEVVGLLACNTTGYHQMFQVLFTIDLFSLYILFSHFRPHDALMGIFLLFFH